MESSDLTSHGILPKKRNPPELSKTKGSTPSNTGNSTFLVQEPLRVRYCSLKCCRKNLFATLSSDPSPPSTEVKRGSIAAEIAELKTEKRMQNWYGAPGCDAAVAGEVAGSHGDAWRCAVILAGLHSDARWLTGLRVVAGLVSCRSLFLAAVAGWTNY